MTQELKIEGYCLKCKEKRMMQDAQAEWASNGSPATRGKCPVCGTTMYKRGRTEAHDSLPKPEITKLAKSKKKTTKKKSQKKSKKTSSAGRSGKLVIVESPAKAKTIGRYLGRGYKVKSSVGHVRDLLKSRLSVDVEDDFTPEYRVPNDKRPVVKELKAAAATAKEIYLATDPDREGEAIAWHVLESAEMEPERTKRVVFQEITKSAILEAFEHPREIDMQRVDAQQARRILDRLVGYKLSPLLWRKVQRGLSAGRVQSVAVRLIVEREEAIDEFEPTEYWYIKAHIQQQKPQSMPFIAKLHRYQGEEPVLNSKEDVLPHLEVLERSTWSVGQVRLGNRTRRPSAPFTTSTLQQEASRRLNFGTTKTMRIAQQLYEGIKLGAETTGLITYMRTDSVTVSKEAQAATRVYIGQEFGDEYVPAKPPIYKTRSKTAQEAHEAIRPTGVTRVPKAIKSDLSRDQYRLYKLIWERFVASQMAPALYDTVSADIYVGEANQPIKKRPYMFRAAGSTLRFKGFLALYEESKSEDEQVEEESRVPSDLQKEELLDLNKLLPEQHFTQPPPRFTEATLVRGLEENGIGRPSTYASIISTIQNRGYVVREDKRLYPTQIGTLVNKLLVEHFPNILSTDFTARLEDQLDDIAQGKAAWVPVLRDFYRPFSDKLVKAEEAIPKQDIQKEVEYVGRTCPECGEGDLVYRASRFGKFIGCNNFPKCRHTEQVIVKTGAVCPVNGGEIIEKRTRKGRVFYGCSRYPDCDWSSWKKPFPKQDTGCNGVWVPITKSKTECIPCGLKDVSEQARSLSDAESKVK